MVTKTEQKINKLYAQEILDMDNKELQELKDEQRAEIQRGER